jgi:Alpha/beta hydrolase of unknown function (DUF900)
MNRKLLASVEVLTIITLSILVITQSALGQSTSIPETITQPPLSIFSTRINTSFDPIQLTQLINYTIAKFNGTCPPEIAIYIHGFNRDQSGAGEEFNRVQMSLKHNNYTIPLIGFSWISNTDWEKAKNTAKANGPELAKFIIALKKENNCPNTNIHIIAHSLGAAVVDSTLVNLDFYLDSKTSNNSKIIKSIHLLGAAINNKLIAKNTPFGNAIEHVVENFSNLYNSQDDGLEFNKVFEKHDPLGLIGLPSADHPVNYNETDVADKIIALSDADGDGNLEECFEDIKPVLERGDNHCGYIGFRQPFSASLIDDGVMDMVVRDLQKR